MIDRNSPLHELAIFHQWLARAPRGARYTYHAGNLMKDRYRGDGHNIPVEPFNNLALAAWASHEAGDVLLCQKRICAEGGTCLYLAVSTGRRAERNRFDVV